MIIRMLPNSANGPGYEYGQEAAAIFGLDYCHQLALAGEILVYDSCPQSDVAARDRTRVKSQLTELE
jgi:hypothetical protein